MCVLRMEQPGQILPITLDVGCNTASIREDPLYVGLPQMRLDTPAYDALLDELVAALRARFGPALLLHWEDLSSRNSYRLLAKYRAEVLHHCVGPLDPYTLVSIKSYTPNPLNQLKPQLSLRWPYLLAVPHAAI